MTIDNKVILIYLYSMTEIIKDIKTAVREIKQGNVIALPTETVYGLGANALNPEAVIKIFAIKERPVFNPLIVHIDSAEKIKNIAKSVPEDVYKIAEKFSPGPVTFVLKKKKIIPDIVTAGLDSVAVRIPSHKLFQEVIKLCGLPVAAPSANMFGHISPTTAKDVYKELNGKINYILDGGKCSVGIESTIISFSEDGITILRPGYITKNDIEGVTGKKVFIHKTKKILSPGMMKSHYAPATPLFLTDDTDKFKDLKNPDIGILDITDYTDMKKLAKELFSKIRELDNKGYKIIITSKVENSGIGIAVNDRLIRASSGTVFFDKGKIRFIKKDNQDA